MFADKKCLAVQLYCLTLADLARVARAPLALSTPLQVDGLLIESCHSRLVALKHALELQEGAAEQLAIRVPHLLLLRPTLIFQLGSELQQLLGGVEQARELVLRDPRVSSGLQHVYHAVIGNCNVCAVTACMQ